MKFSVVIPTHNRAHTLPRALDSVLTQSLPADEIIVIDDGSTDTTQNLLSKHYPQVTTLVQPNQGVSAARNSGIRCAQGEWIALLDSDDAWLPEKLHKIQNSIEDHPQLKLFHSEEIWIRHGTRVNAMHKHRKSGGDIFEQCLPLCVISPSAAVIHRTVFETTGLFDESLPACEDYDFWLRYCATAPVGFIDEALITKYGGHEDQLSQRFWGMDRFRVKVLYRLLQQQSLSPAQKTKTRDMLLKKLRILLKGAAKHHNHALVEEWQPVLCRLQANS